MTTRTCKKCGWVAFAVTRQYAEDGVSRFNEFIDAADAETKVMYGNRRSSIKSYERCFFCSGPHTNFRDSAPSDAPDGVTMQPIIVEDVK